MIACNPAGINFHGFPSYTLPVIGIIWSARNILIESFTYLNRNNLLFCVNI